MKLPWPNDATILQTHAAPAETPSSRSQSWAYRHWRHLISYIAADPHNQGAAELTYGPSYSPEALKIHVGEQLDYRLDMILKSAGIDPDDEDPPQLRSPPQSM